jgi:hypothetical protein
MCSHLPSTSVTAFEEACGKYRDSVLYPDGDKEDASLKYMFHNDSMCSHLSSMVTTFVRRLHDNNMCSHYSGTVTAFEKAS